MRLRSVLSESLRNLASGTTRAALFALVLVGLVGALALADVLATVDVLQQAERYRSSGSAVHVLEVAGGVDGTRCAALAGASGVVAAGAIRQADTVRALALPATRLTTWEVTPGLVDLLPHVDAHVSADDDVPGVWYSRDLAETLGAVPGREIATADGPVATAGVFAWPDDGRARTLGYSALAPVAATGVFDQCWVHVWPIDPDAATLVYIAADPTKTELVTVTRLNSSLGSHFDTRAMLERRPTRYAPWAAVVVGLALGLAAVRLRRLEIAAVLHARVRKAHVAWQMMLETLAWVAAGAAIMAAGIAVAARLDNPGPGMFTVLVGARTIVAGSAAVLLGALLATLLTRERHLFRYSKDR